MNVDEYVQTLTGHGTLAGFEDDELRALIEACETQTFHSGDALWTSGEARSHAFILVNGEIEQATKSYVKRKAKHYSETGTILSISALVKPWSYHSTAYAVERSDVLALSREKFQELFADEEPVAFRLIDAIGEYLVADMRDANDRLQDVFGHPAETLRMLRRRIREDTKA